MIEKKLSTNLAFDLALAPKRKLSPKLRGELWHTLLSRSFQSAIGKPELDHVVTGSGGESHIEYDTKGIVVTAYDDGDLTLFDPNFSQTRLAELERILMAFFQIVNHAVKGRIVFNTNARLHMMRRDRLVVKFLNDNIKFTSGSKLQKALGDFMGLRSFLLKLSENLDMVVLSPDHVDFLYHTVLASDSKRKTFLGKFVTRSMKYLSDMRRYAQ